MSGIQNFGSLGTGGQAIDVNTLLRALLSTPQGQALLSQMVGGTGATTGSTVLPAQTVGAAAPGLMSGGLASGGGGITPVGPGFTGVSTVNTNVNNPTTTAAMANINRLAAS
jgi:hypothetical protein